MCMLHFIFHYMSEGAPTLSAGVVTPLCLLGPLALEIQKEDT